MSELDLIRRAYFDCVSCAEAPLPKEYQVHRADRLRMVGGELWCEECFDASGAFPDQEWRALPAFDPATAIARGKAEQDKATIFVDGDDSIKGFLKKCYLKLRDDATEAMFYSRKDGTCVATLDGYAIVPRTEYYQLRNILDRIENPDEALVEAVGRAVFVEWSWRRHRDEFQPKIQAAIKRLARTLTEKEDSDG